jgi:multisubunit Na+/H+ antiporter MnhC subunit
MTTWTTTVHILILAGVLLILRHDIQKVVISLKDGIVILFRNGKDDG